MSFVLLFAYNDTKFQSPVVVIVPNIIIIDETTVQTKVQT